MATMSPKLDSYLRTYRLKSGLTQKDLGFVFSLNSGSPISQIEKQHKLPSTKVLLAYCSLFDAKPEELLPGLILEIDTVVLKRALVLIKQIEKRKQSGLTIQRIQFLEDFCENKGQELSRKV